MRSGQARFSLFRQLPEEPGVSEIRPENYAPCFLIRVQGRELRHGVTVDVLSVSVTDHADRADSFTFTLRDRHPEAERLFAGGDQLHWMDSDTFDEGNRVEIHIGYVDNMQPMIAGEVTALTPNFPANGLPTLTVQGYSLFHRLQRNRIRRPFKTSRDSDIVREIAAAMNLNASVDHTEAEHPTVSPVGETYASFLRQRAERIGYEVFVKQDTLYFKRPRYLENPGPDLTLEWGRSLISFSPRLSTYSAVTRVTARGPQTSQGRGKEPLVGTANTGDIRVRMGTETGQQICERCFGEHHLLIEDHNIASAAEAREMSLGRMEKEAMNYITGRGSCMGNPQLMARKVIELKGLGKRFSGRYYVTSATHSISSRGYMTDFEVKRNAR